MPCDLSCSLRCEAGTPVSAISTARLPLPQRVKDKVHAVERDAIMSALKDAMGNKAEAARLLGIDYKTYRTKLKMLDTEREAVAP